MPISAKPGLLLTLAALILIIGGVVLSLSFGEEAPADDAAAPVVLITGSNRGLGLALTREYAARGWKVIATCRNVAEATDLAALAQDHPNVTIESLDVTDDSEIATLAQKLDGKPIDVLINNAGSNAGGRGQKLGELDYSVFSDLMQVNALGPFKLSNALLPNILASKQKKIVVITSVQASITKTFGGSYFYRASKTALNMMMRTLAKDLESQGIIVGILSPGIVATDMTKGVDIPKETPEEAARALADVVQDLTLSRSGEFINVDGTTLPW